MVNLLPPSLVDQWGHPLRRGAGKLLCAVYPARCRCCFAAGDGADDLCAACREELPWNTVACPRCALPAPGDPCPGCGRGTPTPVRAVAPLRYEGTIAAWVQAFKHHGRLADGRLLGTLLGRAVARDLQARAPGEWPGAIVPIPLHTRRLRQRGFDQNRELLRQILRPAPPIPVLHALERTRHTDAQQTLSARARQQNLADALTVRRRLRDRLPERVAILDDVITTGATLRAACSALARHGVRRFEWWAVARTPE